MTDFILIFISAALVNNFVLQQPIAVDPVLATSVQTANTRARVHALGIATLSLMLVSSLVGYGVYRYVLLPWGFGFLSLFVFLPTLVLLISPTLRALDRMFPRLPLDGLHLLLIGNAGVLGLMVLGTEPDKGLIHTVALSLGGGLGFWLVLSLFDDLTGRLRQQHIPTPFQGLPIQLIGAGLMGLAFLGFSGLVKP
ncbi:MAG TPA: Rnf-Nqr domain containing protein [Pseudomonas sp.]|jgi:electron transport complex protein RnfA|uniref:Rnf-Nqr domain containing protein n=1 Tax=Pseudomonas sp. TaxID=306 RepID=UPI002ED82C2E